MTRRAFLLIAAACLACAAVIGAGAWRGTQEQPALPEAPVAMTAPPPAAPPRVTCHALLADTPLAALRHAETWLAGSEAARHCAALALLALGQPFEAAERLEQLALDSTAAGPPRARLLLQAAQAWMLAGEAAPALAAASRGLRLMPDDPALRLERAALLVAAGRHAEALADLDAALALDPGRVEALVFRAATLRRLDRIEAALAAIGLALALDPDHAEALLERGILRKLGGDARGARTDWLRAMRLAPDTPAAALAAQNLALSEFGPAAPD